MSVNKILSDHSDFPSKLKHIHSTPQYLYVAGNIEPLLTSPVVSIVGSRAVTPYGRQVTMKLAGELAGKGVAIVSGLALGVDALAHQAALETGGYTAAVLPSPVDQPYPATNRQLAKRILDRGGALLSEYAAVDKASPAFKSNFIARNRLVSGLADVLLITEASERSGSLHTANFALEQGKTVMAVPGNIFSPSSQGTNNLIKAGALPVTNSNDVLAQLGLGNLERQDFIAANQHEAAVLGLLQAGVSDAQALLEASRLSTELFNQTLTMLEISGKIRPLGAGHWSLK